MKNQMCRCHAEFRGGHHIGRYRDYDLPLMSIEEEVKALEEMRKALEKRLETVNKRLEALKR